MIVASDIAYPGVISSILNSQFFLVLYRLTLNGISTAPIPAKTPITCNEFLSSNGDSRVFNPLCNIVIAAIGGMAINADRETARIAAYRL